MYHINDKGEPGLCSAEIGNCRFGNANSHYPDKDTARLAYEKSMERTGIVSDRGQHARITGLKWAGTPEYLNNGTYIGVEVLAPLNRFYDVLQSHVGKDKLQILKSFKKERDKGINHVTLITPPELSTIRKTNRDRRKNSLPPIDIKLPEKMTFITKGIGTVKGFNEKLNTECETYYVILSCPEGAAFRESLNLKAHDFHLTLGFNNADVHNVSKGKDTLLKENGI